MSRKLSAESTRPRHASLAVVLQVRGGALQVLLWKRARDPYRGAWALPGGLLEPGETLEASIRRHLAAKVDVREVSHIEQLATYSDPARDPSAWELATAYLGLVELGLDPDVPDDTRWHAVDDLPSTAFDHGGIVLAGRERLRGKLSYSNARVRARAADVHPRGAARGLRRGAGPRRLRDEPPACARAARRDRADGRAPAVGPRRGPARRGVPLSRPQTRDHRPVRGTSPEALRLSGARAPDRRASPSAGRAREQRQPRRSRPAPARAAGNRTPCRAARPTEWTSAPGD